MIYLLPQIIILRKQFLTVSFWVHLRSSKSSRTQNQQHTQQMPNNLFPTSAQYFCGKELRRHPEYGAKNWAESEAVAC